MRLTLAVAVILILLTSCNRAPQGAASLVPAALDGGWSRVEHRELAADEVPDLVRSLGWKQSVSARYAGPATMEVSLHEMTSPTVAFECAQKWRHAPGTMAFHHGRRFVLVEGEARWLQTFISALEKQLGE